MKAKDPEEIFLSGSKALASMLDLLEEEQKAYFFREVERGTGPEEALLYAGLYGKHIDGGIVTNPPTYLRYLLKVNPILWCMIVNSQELGEDLFHILGKAMKREP